MNVTTHQEKEKNEKDKEGQKKRKSKNRQPILKKLCAALLCSFRGQHSEKIKGSAWGNLDPWNGQQPFRPNPNRVRGHTTTLRRLLPLIKRRRRMRIQSRAIEGQEKRRENRRPILRKQYATLLRSFREQHREK